MVPSPTGLRTSSGILIARTIAEGERKAGRRLHRTFDAIQDALLLIDAQQTIERLSRSGLAGQVLAGAVTRTRAVLSALLLRPGLPPVATRYT